MWSFQVHKHHPPTTQNLHLWRAAKQDKVAIKGKVLKRLVPQLKHANFKEAFLHRSSHGVMVMRLYLMDRPVSAVKNTNWKLQCQVTARQQWFVHWMLARELKDTTYMKSSASRESSPHVSCSHSRKPSPPLCHLSSEPSISSMLLRCSSLSSAHEPVPHLEQDNRPLMTSSTTMTYPLTRDSWLAGTDLSK